MQYERRCLILFTSLFLSFQYVNTHAGHEAQEKEISRENRGELHDPTPVLLMSMDGFRANYLDRMPELTENNYFENIFKNGVMAPNGILNAYTTLTFPNHYSIATGLYEESHGILGNSIYDIDHNRSVNVISRETYTGQKLNPSEMATFYGGEPIWVTYMKQRGKSTMASVMWPASDLPIQNMPIDSDKVVSYNGDDSCDRNVQKAVNYLKAGARLVLLYFHQPDGVGHKFGPDSKEMNETLISLNDCLGKLWNSMNESNIKPNFILTSDHGMAPTSGYLVIPKNDDLFVIRTNHHDHWLLEPLPGKLEETVKYVQEKGGNNVTVYTKNNIPPRWHYAKNRRITDVLVVANEGVQMVYENKPPDNRLKGEHGYDNSLKDMRPIFRAVGPDFVKNSKLEGFKNTDIYLTVCKLLGLNPAPNNATESGVNAVLSGQGHGLMSFFENGASAMVSSGFVILCSIIFAVSFALMFLICYHRRKSLHGDYAVRATPFSNGYRYRPMFGEEVVTLCSDSDDEDQLFLAESK